MLTASDPLLRLRYPDHVRLEVLPRSDDEDEDHVGHDDRHGSKRGNGDGDSDEEEHDERVLLHHALHNSRAHHMGVQPLQQLEDGDDSDHSDDDDDDDDDGGDDDDDGEGDEGSDHGGDDKAAVAQRTSKKQDVGGRDQGVPAGARPASKAGAGAASDSEDSGSVDGNNSDDGDGDGGDDDDDEMPRRTLALPSYTARPLGLLVRNGSNFTRMSELEALCCEPGDASGEGGAAGEAVEDRDSQAAMMARALVMVLAQQGLLEGRAK